MVFYPQIRQALEKSALIIIPQADKEGSPGHGIPVYILVIMIQEILDISFEGQPPIPIKI
jgi:hypothetical protein